MTARSLDFLPVEKQLFARDIASALAELLRQKGLTAKQAARRYDLDAATVANIRKGVCSLSTLLKVALVEGRDLWQRLGDAIYDETWEQYEERQLRRLIEEGQDAHQRLISLRARREELDARADRAIRALDGESARQRRDGAVDDRASVDSLGDGATGARRS